ncbi:MAG: lysozyme inhibitor LprI family protein [Pseudomonadota bacterium]
MPSLRWVLLCLWPAATAAEDWHPNDEWPSFIGDRSAFEVQAQTCLNGDSGDAFVACANTLVSACYARPDGGTTLGMWVCNTAMTRIWDGHLNAQWPNARALAQASDAQSRTHFPEFAQMWDSLLASQRAWIAFRDAQCTFAYAQWGSGSFRNVAGTGCTMDMTAVRAKVLYDLVASAR